MEAFPLVDNAAFDTMVVPDVENLAHVSLVTGATFARASEQESERASDILLDKNLVAVNFRCWRGRAGTIAI